MSCMKQNILNAFPGYRYDYFNGSSKKTNVYRDTDVGSGGYVYSNPGMYQNIALLDIASMHPTSIIAMNCFGEYTKKFEDIMNARIAIKHGDFNTARSMLNGKLARYLEDETTAKDLAQALKIAINSVYGLSAAKFDNPFRDSRNINNIVALRGALFMRTLQDEVENRGFTIVAIRTDSIKIADATQEIIDFCMDFATKYGYIFEHEATYERMCQINDADYIARYDNGEWTATGKQFQVPYVYKKLFTKEPIVFDDLCETFSVAKGDLYLDINEGLPDVSYYEQLKEYRSSNADKLTKKALSLLDETSDISDEELDSKIAEGHNYRFVGRVGRFCPIEPGGNGGLLYRVNDGKNYAAAGTTGYRWLESEMVKELGIEDRIDMSFYNKLTDDAVDAISKYGDFEWFVSDDSAEVAPWTAADNGEAEMPV